MNEAVGEAAQAGAAGGVSAADAVVGDLDENLPVRAGDVDANAAGTGVLGDVGERLGDEEVDGCLGSCRQPRLRRRIDVHWDRGAFRERAEGGAQALFGEDSRVDAPCEFAQLVERGAQFAVGFGKQLAGAVGVRSELAACELERQPQREQALLCAVVEVPLVSSRAVIQNRSTIL